MTEKWEYTSIYGQANDEKNIAEANRLGKNGWELVSVAPLGNGCGIHILYFKRKLS
jgi:hypothetical protein